MATPAFRFTKLVVDDPEAVESFYRDVFGMKPVHRVTTVEHKYALDEVILSITGQPDSHGLVIARYRGRPCPPAGAAWTGFTVPDIDAALLAVERAGGSIEVPVHDNFEHHVRAAIVADPAGHLVEIIQIMEA